MPSWEPAADSGCRWPDGPKWCASGKEEPQGVVVNDGKWAAGWHFFGWLEAEYGTVDVVGGARQAQLDPDGDMGWSIVRFGFDAFNGTEWRIQRTMLTSLEAC